MKLFISRIKQRFIVLLTSELSPSKLALSLTLGIMVGIVPFLLGLNILLSVIVAWRFKLNHLLLQFISNLFYPIQIMLFVPFLKAGNYFFSNKPIEVSTGMITSTFKQGFWEGMQVFGMWSLRGIMLWLVLFIPVAYLLYHLIYRIIIKSRLIAT